MSLGANVRSIEALKTLRAAVVKFIAESEKALQEVEAEIQRTNDWIVHDRPAHWRSELKKRDQEVAKAKDDLRRVQLTIAERPPSAVEQKKALKRAQQRYEEARQKIQITRLWRSRFEQEVNEYRGQSQLLAGSIESDLPKSITMLDQMLANLDAYLTERAPELDEEMTREVERAAAMTMPVAKKTIAHDLELLRKRCVALRERAPDDAARERIPLVRDIERSDEVHNPSEPILLFDDLDVTPAPPRPGDLIVFEPEFDMAEQIFAARSLTDRKGDSGWYLGAERSAGRETEPLATTASRFLLEFPHYREVLALPPGYLALIRGGDLEAVLDGDDHLVWHRRAGFVGRASPA